MADINIQRKKSAPNPWLLVLLAAVVLGLAAYFFLKPDPTDEASPANTTVETMPTDTLAPGAAAEEASTTPPPVAADSVAPTDTPDDYTPATLAAQAATNPAAPNYALNGLQKLAGVLVALTDRDDLRDAATTEQRDNLTSATARLGEPNAGLRPGFVAAAGLIRAMQQKAYPELENQANELVNLAGQLSGRSATAAEQQQNKQFLTQAATTVRVLSEPKN